MPSRPLALVDYSDDSDSAEDSDSQSAPPAKIRKTEKTDPNSANTPPVPALPPLPPRFHDLYAVPPRVGKNDDPALHGGRKRSIPHVHGNWPTHVFIEWHLTRPEFETLDDICKTAAHEASASNQNLKIETHLWSDLGTEMPLHLSLSRPNVLTTMQREGFLDTLKDRVRRARIAPFSMQFTGFEWVRNYDGTRWFWVLKATKGANNELPRLLHIANRTFSAFGQPPLYSQGSDGMDGFHVSLAWCLSEPSIETVHKMKAFLECGEMAGDKIKLKDDRSSTLSIEVTAVKVKIGNVVHVVNLKAKESLGYKDKS